MKKIISLFMLLFAFSFSANAQEDSKSNPEMSAKKDKEALIEFIALDKEKTEALYGLLLYKHKKHAYMKEEKERKELSPKIDMKFKATLTPEEYEKLISNKELYENLIN